MPELKLVIDFFENTLCSAVNGKKFPLVSKRAHIYFKQPL